MIIVGFKPYYKWITFNTFEELVEGDLDEHFVLNLIINGLPSILTMEEIACMETLVGFKPYYKWITFNTLWMICFMK